LNHVNPPQGSFVVDIGSNDGTQLKIFEKHGMSVLGIDPAPEVAKKANETGIETLQNFFTHKTAIQVRKERGSADIITADNVFANIDDLDDMITGVRELLSSDGCFVIETGYAGGLVENMLIDNVYHEHLLYCCVKSLQKFMDRYCLEIIDAQRISTKGGSIRIFVQHKGGPRSISDAVSRLIQLEENAGIDQGQVYKDISQKIANIKKELTKLLLDIRAQGKTVVGYGASVGVTTLLYLFDLSDKIDFIVDDNKTRHHLFTPGHHIPVLPSEELYKKKPDYVLILAWRYRESIMKKHQQYQKEGGRFIVPLPTIEVI